MTKLIEAYGAVYDHPGKGHDRLFLDSKNQFFGVFDGAGGDELSEAIVQKLPEILARNQRRKKVSPTAFMASVISKIDRLPEGEQRKSTAALGSVALGQQVMEVTYANAGDSSVYFYNKTKDTFRRIAHTPTTYIEANGQTYIDVDDFLGKRRTPREAALLIGHFTLSRSDEWSLVGLTDGVQDDDGKGIDEATLEEIVRYTNAQHVSAAILDNIDKYDDASVFLVKQRIPSAEG